MLNRDSDTVTVVREGGGKELVGSCELWRAEKRTTNKAKLAGAEQLT